MEVFGRSRVSSLVDVIWDGQVSFLSTGWGEWPSVLGLV